MTKLLFVCLGNICRSPTAESIMNKMVSNAGLSENIISDSAGTSAHHEGQFADPRMCEYSLARGYDLTSTSRPFKISDFESFDLILTMDNDNYENLMKIAPYAEAEKKIKKMTSYCLIHSIDQVPDPYYGGDRGFEYVIDILEDSCEQLLKELTK